MPGLWTGCILQGQGDWAQTKGQEQTLQPTLPPADIRSLPMTIHELLAKIPADKIRVQFLHEGDLQAQATRHGCRITFYTGETDPSKILAGTSPVGMVLWIPREHLKQ